MGKSDSKSGTTPGPKSGKSGLNAHASQLTSKFKLDPSAYKQTTVKAKLSCSHCRKIKKKCTRDIDGCYNCIRMKLPCVYGESELNKQMHDQSQSPWGIVGGTPQTGANLLLRTLGFSHLILDKVDSIDPPKISKALAFQFVEAFFKHNHRSYPFICKAVFLEKFDQLEYFSGNVTSCFEFEAYMLMAIGCTTLSRAGLLKQEDISGKFFAYKCIGYLAQGVDIGSIQLIKLLLLLCIYSFFEPEGMHTWNLFGIISRKTIGLGLYRASNFQDNDPLEREMKVRLFWSIYNMDRLLSVSLGRPLTIDEFNVDVPYPAKFDDEDKFTFKTILAIIKLRQIEGNIIMRLYSSRAKDIYSESDIEKIEQDLKDWIEFNLPHSPANLNFFSFHISDGWYLTRYYHNCMLLCRPNYLVPRPDVNRMNLLGDYCLKTLSNTHKLFKANLLPLNWITLYRFLTVCSSLLFCLCNWSIDLNECKSEIYLLVEILNAFSENWIFASKCSEVFQKIVDNIFEVSLNASGDEVGRMKQLSSELLGASSAYHEILDDNSINMPFTDFFLLESTVEK